MKPGPIHSRRLAAAARIINAGYTIQNTAGGVAACSSGEPVIHRRTLRVQHAPVLVQIAVPTERAVHSARTLEQLAELVDPPKPKRKPRRARKAASS